MKVIISSRHKYQKCLGGKLNWLGFEGYGKAPKVILWKGLNEETMVKIIQTRCLFIMPAVPDVNMNNSNGRQERPKDDTTSTSLQTITTNTSTETETAMYRKIFDKAALELLARKCVSSAKGSVNRALEVVTHSINARLVDAAAVIIPNENKGNNNSTSNNETKTTTTVTSRTQLLQQLPLIKLPHVFRAIRDTVGKQEYKVIQGLSQVAQKILCVASTIDTFRKQYAATTKMSDKMDANEGRTSGCNRTISSSDRNIIKAVLLTKNSLREFCIQAASELASIFPNDDTTTTLPAATNKALADITTNSLFLKTIKNEEQFGSIMKKLAQFHLILEDDEGCIHCWQQPSSSSYASLSVITNDQSPETEMASRRPLILGVQLEDLECSLNYQIRDTGFYYLLHKKIW
eukprot:CAMPEP_0194390788 /NCGR_PEP_ID=MMETSP0174-20130528/112048_1 /TAXON_ID=216777 /ORGANISM="Proboscia alata, Strain PI-D3" /LENGTH=404 /DNA_ID=CAMNT_0039184513 /DNA_START=585 /DNA_END=1796 /DNA_ORIENTATION=-